MLQIYCLAWQMFQRKRHLLNAEIIKQGYGFAYARSPVCADRRVSAAGACSACAETPAMSITVNLPLDSRTRNRRDTLLLVAGARVLLVLS